MEIWYHFSYLAQLLIFTVFWLRPLKFKPRLLLRTFVAFTAMVAGILVMNLFPIFAKGSSWLAFSLPYLVILVLLGVGLRLCLDEAGGVVLLTLLLPSTSQLCASVIKDLLFFAFQGNNQNFYLFDLISVFLVCVACVPLSGVYRKLAFYQKETYRLLNTVSYCVVSCIFILNGFTPQIDVRFVRYILVPGYRLLMSVFVFFLIFSLLSVGRMRYQKDMTELLLKKQEQQYAMARELTELVNIKYHDMKHMGASGLKGELLAEDDQRLSLYECVIRSGNPAMDAVLTEKSILCKRLNIDFTRMVDGAALRFMEPVDLYALFGNVLDNAIQCLRALPVEERHVKLRVSAVGGMVNILCENVCHDRLRFENGLPQTTKADTLNHGFGTKSVAHICEKYAARFRLTCEDDLFTLKILLPIPTP